MKNNPIIKSLYLCLPWLPALLLILTAQSSSLTSGTMLLGAVFLPPLTLTCLRGASLPSVGVFAVTSAVLCAISFPNMSVGAVYFAVWFGGAVILRFFIEYTPDLFPILLIGGALFLGLTAVGVIWNVKATLGVWDIQSLYTGMENAILNTFDEVEKFYKAMPLSADMLQTYSEYIKLAKEQIDFYVFRVLLVILTFLAAQYFWTLKAAQFLCRKRQKIEIINVALFTIPKEIAVAFIILNVIALFVSGPYLYAFDLANDMMGYLFALCGIGFFDVLLARKLSATPRFIIRTLLFVAAIISKCFFLEFVYTVLLCAGVFVSLCRRLVILRNKEDEPRE